MLLPSLRPPRFGLLKLNATSVLSKGCPVSPTLFGNYIDKLEECLEVVGCEGAKLGCTVITLLLYVDDIVLLERIHDDLHKQLRILQYFFSKMGMIVNTDMTKVMIIKCKKIKYDNLFYD